MIIDDKLSKWRGRVTQLVTYFPRKATVMLISYIHLVFNGINGL